MSNIIYVTVTATGGRGAAGIGVPVGGTTSQALVKNSATNYDTKWTTVIPNGGTTGQILGKNSNLDLDTIWKDDKGAGLALDFAPAKTAGGVWLPVGISTFTANGNITLTTTYPQIIPLTKLAGDLNLASNIITLPKGFLYRMDLAFMGTGAGYSYLRILDPLNSSLGGTCTVAGSTDTSGRSATSLFTTYDLTSAESDLQIRVANILLGGAVQLQGGYGNFMITKYLKIPFTNL